MKHLSSLKSQKKPYKIHYTRSGFYTYYGSGIINFTPKDGSRSRIVELLGNPSIWAAIKKER